MHVIAHRTPAQDAVLPVTQTKVPGLNFTDPNWPELVYVLIFKPATEATKGEEQ